MSDINIQMTQRNASNTGWDNQYPITKASNVSTAGGSTVEDSLIQYAVATGAANTYSIATPVISSLVAGMAVSVKINVSSTNTSTLNWNGKGAKTIKKANGSNATNLKAGGVYTLRYDGTNFILQGEGGSGNAVASDLLSGKTADTDAGEIVGTIPTIPTAYSDQANAIAVSVGTWSGDGKNYAYLGIPQYSYTGALNWIKREEPDLLPSNIPLGKTIMNIAGANNKQYGVGDKIAYGNLGFTSPPMIIKDAISGSMRPIRGVSGYNGVIVFSYNSTLYGYDKYKNQLWATTVGFSTNGGIQYVECVGDYAYVSTSQNGGNVGIAKFRISTGERIWYSVYNYNGYSHDIRAITVSPTGNVMWLFKDYYDGNSWYYTLLKIDTATGNTISTYYPGYTNNSSNYKILYAIDDNSFLTWNGTTGLLALVDTSAPTSTVWTKQIGSSTSEKPTSIVKIGSDYFLRFNDHIYKTANKALATDLGLVPSNSSYSKNVLGETNSGSLLVPTNSGNYVYDVNGVQLGTLTLTSGGGIYHISRFDNYDYYHLDIYNVSSFNFTILQIILTIQ